MSDQDNLQNSRIRDIEKRVNVLENQFHAIMAELNLVKKMAQGIALLASAALGVDIVPMMQA
tara:strand:- start:2956 stop:3141 length:186 start_codon:yes stop_codon:yes gene_type:complete